MIHQRLATGHVILKLASSAGATLVVTGAGVIVLETTPRVPVNQSCARRGDDSVGGVCGFLTGPPMIGLTAQLVGLRLALGLLIAATLSVAGPARTARPAQRMARPGQVAL